MSGINFFIFFIVIDVVDAHFITTIFVAPMKSDVINSITRIHPGREHRQYAATVGLLGLLDLFLKTLDLVHQLGFTLVVAVLVTHLFHGVGPGGNTSTELPFVFSLFVALVCVM